MAKGDAHIPKSAATRKAIGRVRDAGIKQELLTQIEGAEICLKHRRQKIAGGCVASVATVAMTLSKTLGPTVSTAILQGLWSDTEQGAEAAVLRRNIGFSSSDNRLCKIIDGSPIGSSSCVRKRGAICVVPSSGSGCGGSSGFHFVWTQRVA